MNKILISLFFIFTLIKSEIILSQNKQLTNIEKAEMHNKAILVFEKYLSRLIFLPDPYTDFESMFQLTIKEAFGNPESNPLVYHFINAQNQLTTDTKATQFLRELKATKITNFEIFKPNSSAYFTSEFKNTPSELVFSLFTQLKPRWTINRKNYQDEHYCQIVFAANALDFKQIYIKSIQKIEKIPAKAIPFGHELKSNYDVCDAAFDLATEIKAYLKSISFSGTIIMGSVTYKNCGFSIEFAENIKACLRSSLAPLNIRNIPENNTQNLILRGYYQETESRQLEVVLDIIAPDKKQRRFSNNLTSLKTVENTNTNFIPDAYYSMIDVNSSIVNNLPASDESLHLEVNTNKGSESVIYWQGEQMEITVQANKSCFVRIFDRLNDSTILLLENNRRISTYEINKNISIGNYPCEPPFGNEVIIVYASTEPFETLDTELIGNLEFIKIRSLSDAVKAAANVRAFGKSNPKVSYKRINITTKSMDFN